MQIKKRPHLNLKVEENAWKYSLALSGSKSPRKVFEVNFLDRVIVPRVIILSEKH